MESIEIIYIFLGGIAILLIAAFIRLGSILFELQFNARVSNAYNDDHYKQRNQLLEAQKEILDNLIQLQSDVTDMKYVSDIFYQYKLPDKKEREMLDQIAIDNEVLDGIARARSKST